MRIRRRLQQHLAGRYAGPWPSSTSLSYGGAQVVGASKGDQHQESSGFNMDGFAPFANFGGGGSLHSLHAYRVLLISMHYCYCSFYYYESIEDLWKASVALVVLAPQVP